MNICIDIGNTNSKIGFFDHVDNIEIIQQVPDRKIANILKEQNPDNILISCVRKGMGKLYIKSQQIANTIIFKHTTPIPIKILYQTPETLGLDRIASAVGASSMYPGKNCLVVDLGTCITYDFIDATGNYHGGGISPGLEMRLKAMHKFTSKLPKVVPSGKLELIGKSTKECMLSGAVYGSIAELEGIIDRYKQFFDGLTIIFCGGDAIFFESKIKDHIFAIPNLVLIGLNQILRYNVHD